MTPLDSARIVLGVSGGIAAYKAADLASKLVQAGACVDVILTAGAREFIQPLTFQAITKRPVRTGPFEGWTAESFGHITLAQEADLLLVAPATANTIARLAHGFADDMLGAVALATPAPLLLAPAMEHGMFHHAATQANLATLRERGAFVVGPEPGRLASGQQGDGRLAAPETIAGAARWLLGRNGPLAGRQVVVTAGGTREPLDPVRFLGNRSSGQMGYALAQAALDAGAATTLISTVARPAPFGATLRLVETAAEMQQAVTCAVAAADVLIMAAAVADFRPANPAGGKIKKQPGQTALDLALTRTPDILAEIDQPTLLKIGFAAETDDLVANARQKLASKGLAMIVANDAVATIGSDESSAVLIGRDGALDALPRMAKPELASVIISRIAVQLAARDRDKDERNSKVGAP